MMLEMFYTYTMECSSHMWLLDTSNVISSPEKLIFHFN